MLFRSNFKNLPLPILERYSTTPFYKKSLFWVVFLILFLVIGFFIFRIAKANAFDWVQDEWAITSDGVMTIPPAYCDNQPTTDDNAGSYFDGEKPFEGTTIYGVSASGYCTALLDPPFDDMNYQNTFGDGIYYHYFRNSNGWWYSRFQKTGSVWSLIPLSCSLEHCSLCATSDECLGVGCIWEYNTGFGRWECHQEYIPYVLNCAGFRNSCYACHTQEDCENAIPTGVCEWVDRGYGNGCYPIEIAPTEAGWEAPTLENCDELSGVEKWLCIIKNFIASIFMPTQEKVENLEKTIDNFKLKFPFNYAGSLSAFFTTIKTSLATKKEIPVKILGTERNVSFVFWEKTTPIGGVSETFKNILFDFTTILIIIAFAVWIISFIKRIF